MHTFTIELGRLCNQIIRNLCVSIISEKHDLYVEYSQYDKILQLGIQLFIGKNKYENFIELNDDNYFSILNLENLTYNINPNSHYFQTKRITNYLYSYLKSSTIMENIINKNPFKQRYNNNDDLILHIRLTDAAHYCFSINYFEKIISLNNYNNLYIATDDINHSIVKYLKDNYNAIVLDLDEIKTIQFASTCKYVGLSQGTFSAVIGYLSFFSIVYYKTLEKDKLWHGDIFSIPHWKCLE
jgi:hypothetical protein